MTEIQQNRWDRLVRRVAGIVGGGSQVNDTLNELFPTLDVENVPIELLALAKMNVCWGSARQLASAAEFNHHQIFNPAGSGALIAVTQVAFSSGSNTFIRIGVSSAALLTLSGNERRRDTRAGVLADPVGQIRRDQNAAGGFLDLHVRVLADETTYLRDQNGIAVLFPGTGLNVSTEVLNIESTVGFLWRERAFEPSELVG